MTTLDDAYRTRWQLIAPDLAYHSDWGVPTFWRQHPELGSPADDEQDLGNGETVQVFTGGIVLWNPAKGAQILDG